MTLVECDAAFWARACGERPVALEDRQSVIYGLGQRRCRTEWLLVVDADEYVFGDRSIPSFLGAIPDEAESVSLPTAEAVWGPGDPIDAPFGSTHFRRGVAAHRGSGGWRGGRSTAAWEPTCAGASSGTSAASSSSGPIAATRQFATMTRCATAGC